VKAKPKGAKRIAVKRWILRRLPMLRLRIEKRSEWRSIEDRLSDERDPDRRQLLLQERAQLGHRYEEERRYYLTRKLERKAGRMLLAVPDRPREEDADDQFWEMTHGGWIFTPVGFMHVRQLIQTAQENRHRCLLQWAAALTGLIGAVTGLASVLKGD